jgi:hypothetical protein
LDQLQLQQHGKLWHGRLQGQKRLLCDPLPIAPSGTPTLLVAKSGGGVLLSWSTVAGATEYDIVRGDLGVLKGSGGDFAAATAECLDDNRTTALLLHAPPAASNVWFLVRPANCGGGGTYDSGGLGQIGARDAEIAASASDCP